MRLYLMSLVCLSTALIGASGELAEAQPPRAGDPEATAASGATPVRSEIVPLGDYHVHVVGPYALPLPEPLLPSVEVPTELRLLLDARARLVGNVTGPEVLSEVFTEDAQLLNAYIAPSAWMRDRFWFERYLNLWPKVQLRFVANQYSIVGSSGYIAGTVQAVPSNTHIQNFLLAILKGTDGRWRIAADSTTEKTPHRFQAPLTAAALVRDLDAAGIRRATVLSVAFWLGSRGGESGTRRMTELPTEEAAVRAENEWTAQQVAQFPDRLILACAVNPLKDYAIAELEHCARQLNAKAMKLNFGDSGVSFDNPAHIEQLRRFFAAANSNGQAIVVHLEPGRHYGRAEVELFLNRIASAAPDITIQLAHMAGNGPGITSPEALSVFAELREAKDPRTNNLYFDLGGIVYRDMGAAAAQLLVTRMRQIGLDRVLFASDFAPDLPSGNPLPADQWEWTRRLLPLTDAELHQLAQNVPPYMR